MRRICGITTLNALMMKESLHFNFCLKRVLVERLDVDTATLMMSGMTCDIHRLTPVSWHHDTPDSRDTSLTWQLTEPSTSLSSWVTLLSLKGKCLWPLRIPRMTLPRPAMVMEPPMVLVLSQHPKSIRCSLDLPPRRTGLVWGWASLLTECWYTCNVNRKWESRPWRGIIFLQDSIIFLFYRISPERPRICYWGRSQDSSRLFLRSRLEFRTDFAHSSPSPGWGLWWLDLIIM